MCKRYERVSRPVRVIRLVLVFLFSLPDISFSMSGQLRDIRSVRESSCFVVRLSGRDLSTCPRGTFASLTSRYADNRPGAAVFIVGSFWAPTIRPRRGLLLMLCCRPYRSSSVQAESRIEAPRWTTALRCLLLLPLPRNTTAETTTVPTRLTTTSDKPHFIAVRTASHQEFTPRHWPQLQH